MIVKTNLKPRDYSEKEIVRIANREQQTFYVSRYVFPIDIYPSMNKNGKQIIAMIFLKSDTQELYREWCSRIIEEAKDDLP